MLRLKQNTLDGITVVMASCQTSIVPSCSRIAEVLYRVQKVALFKAGRGQTNNARQDYCAYGQLPDLVSSQMEQNKSTVLSRSWPVAGQSTCGGKNQKAKHIYCGYGQLLTSFVPGSSRIAAISRQCCDGHGQLPDYERDEAKKNKPRHKYCGYGQLVDLVCSQLEQISGNYRRGCHGNGLLPDRERAEEKKTYR